MEQIKAVVFDIDGTLTPNASSWLALTHDLGGSVEEHKKLFQGFKDGSLSYEESKTRLVDLWRATGHATRGDVERIFNSWPIHEDAKEFISFLQNKGVHVALITGSVTMYAKIVAEKCGIQDYYANGELLFDAENILVDFTFPADESKQKLEHLYAFCKKISVTPTEVAAVGDSGNDVHIFTETKHGVLIGMEKPPELQKIAWKEANSFSEAKDLLSPLLP